MLKKYLKNFVKKLPNVLLIIVAIFLIKISTVNKHAIDGDTILKKIPIDSVKKIFPNVDKILKRSHNKHLYDVYNNGKSIGVIMYSNSDSVKGYSGKVPLIVGVNKNNIIKNIVILKNSETPAFLQRTKDQGLLKKWEGLSLQQAKNQKVETVTGATFSSTAIVKNMTKLLGKNTKNININIAHKSRIIRQTIVLSILLVLGVLAYFTRHVRVYRLYLHILNIIFFGFLTGTFLSIYIFNNWIVQGVDFFSFPVIYVIAIISISIPLFTNKAFYCTYICPYGALQEVIGKIGSKFTHKRSMHVHLHKFKNILLLSILLVIILNKTFDLSQLEPFTAFIFRASSISAIVIALIFAIMSFFYTKPWCKGFCPTGKVLEILRVPIIKQDKK